MNQLEKAKTWMDDFSSSLTENQQVSLRYILTLLPFVLILGSICFINQGLLVRSIQIFAFAAAGGLHLLYPRNRIFVFFGQFLGKGIIYTLSMALAICIALLVFYLITGRSMVFMAMVSSSAFMMPHILLHARLLWHKMWEKNYQPWVSPETKKDIEEEIYLPELIKVGLKFTRKSSDAMEDQVTRVVPIQMKAGLFFYNIVDECKGADRQIEVVNGDNKPYCWEFYVTGFKGIYKRRIDPEKTFLENAVRPRSVIFIKRGVS